MAARKVLLRSQAGVRLERIEGKSRKPAQYRLLVRRTGLQRLLCDEAKAHRMFAREVAAKLMDERGWFIEG